jgi:hypothetical protein
MPTLDTLDSAIADASRDDHRRCVFLVDLQHQEFVSCSYQNHYNTSLSLDGVKQLFPSAFQEWKQGVPCDHHAIFDCLGLFKITVVTKTNLGGIILADGENFSVDHYMGLG